MAFDPTEIVGEVLGKPARAGPSLADYKCPFLNSVCLKRSTALPGRPYPVCSIWAGAGSSRKLIAVCPQRFRETNFLRDVANHCWPGEPPKTLQVAREVKMRGFGTVDFVVADLDSHGEVAKFLSVELQAIDITGSVMRAYAALTEGKELPRRPKYGLNWDNVYKRYITQLIRKGFFHHHWQTKIVSVIQDVVYKNICERAAFMRSTDVASQTVNIIFLAYRFEFDSATESHRLVLDTVEGTSHANLQQAILYKTPPSRDEFCARIKKNLSGSISLD